MRGSRRIRQLARGLLFAFIFLVIRLGRIHAFTSTGFNLNSQAIIYQSPVIWRDLVTLCSNDDEDNFLSSSGLDSSADETKLDMIDINDDEEEDMVVDFEESLLASPLSQVWGEENDAKENWFPGSFSREENWLEGATDEVLDEEMLPLGSLTEDDVLSITGLMSAWVRRRSIDAALRVEQLLKRVVDDMRAGNSEVHVTTRMYTIAIDAWAKSGEKEGPKRAQQIHDGMIEMYKQSCDPMIAPSTISYNTLLNSWAKSSHHSSVDMAEALFEDMLESDEETVRPDVLTFSTLLDVYSRSEKADAVERAEEKFQLMTKLGVQRNVYTFSALQNVYARSGRHDAPHECQKILDKMIQQSKNGDIFAKPNCINYNSVLGALSRARTKEAVEQACAMLEKMEKADGDGGFDIEPDRLSYALTILACSRCPNIVYGADMAERILEKMEARAKKEAKRREEVSSAAPPSVTLDLESFNVVLTAISKTRTSNAIVRTIRIVKRMENYAEDGHMQVMPNTRSWNAVLHSLSRSQDKSINKGERAEQILDHMFDLYRKGAMKTKPDAYSFAAILSTYQTIGGKAATERADEIVRHMEQLYERGEIDTHPDTVHYSIVCAAWAKIQDKRAGSRVVDILSRMKDKDRSGIPNVRPNIRTYNSCLDALCRAGEADKAEQLLYHMLALSKDGDGDAKPDAFSFNVVISGFARTQKRGTGQTAESLLERFLEFSEENPDCKPDTRSFTHIIAHYARMRNQPDAPYRAENVLNRLLFLFETGHRHLIPSVFAFTEVMDAYASQKHPDAGEYAERLVRTMKKLKKKYNVSELEINSGVLNTVLNCYLASSNPNSGERANTLLKHMEMQSDMEGDKSITPNGRTYSLVMNIWSKLDASDKAEQALRLLRHAQERAQRNRFSVMSSRPNDFLHAIVINTCAFTKGEENIEKRAFEIAVECLTEVIQEDSKISASSKTFAWFFQACDHLNVPQELKDENLERAFDVCRSKGLVNDFALTRFVEAASDEVLERAMRPILHKLQSAVTEAGMEGVRRRISLYHLPAEWKRWYQKPKERQVASNYEGKRRGLRNTERVNRK